MGSLGQILLITNALAWFFVIWLPARRSILSFLSFIPAMLLSMVIPAFIAPRTPPVYYYFWGIWAILPFIILIIELVWGNRKRNSNNGVQRTRHKVSGPLTPDVRTENERCGTMRSKGATAMHMPGFGNGNETAEQPK